MCRDVLFLIYSVFTNSYDSSERIFEENVMVSKKNISGICRIFGALLFSLLICFGGNVSSASETYIPFQPGEKFIFKLRWGVVPAGEASLEVKELDNIKGVEAYHFVMKARSNSFFDVFFKVRDHIDSFTDTAMNHSLYYRKDQLEGKTKRNIRVYFDWQNNEAEYVFINRKRKTISLLPGTFDPLAIFYYTRTLDMRDRSEFERPVTDGSKNMLGKLRIIGRQKVTVDAGTFDTLLLEPDLQRVDGVFAKKARAKILIWVTDDNRKLPIKLKSKAKVGSFVAELASIEGVGEMLAGNVLR
jgi:hypothetical protein